MARNMETSVFDTNLNDIAQSVKDLIRSQLVKESDKVKKFYEVEYTNRKKELDLDYKKKKRGIRSC